MVKTEKKAKAGLSEEVMVETVEVKGEKVKGEKKKKHKKGKKGAGKENLETPAPTAPTTEAEEPKPKKPAKEVKLLDKSAIGENFIRIVFSIKILFPLLLILFPLLYVKLSSCSTIKILRIYLQFP